tara:strand:+ start:88880 stop:89299 length:420 start_codon:yes stop_codon:yes gene_type:complete
LIVENFIYVFKKSAILLLISLYVITPFKDVISETAHKISHAWNENSNSSSAQHHNHGQEDHHHQHQLISFFEAVFSSESDTSTSDDSILKVTFDKHLTQDTLLIKVLNEPFRKNNYFYYLPVYSTYSSMLTPPPEQHFS